MNRIKGLNDKVTLKRKAIKPAITVWKGAKKSPKSAGKNLNNLFRIEVPEHLKPILKEVYAAEENQGSLLVDRLNLVPAYEDEFKTFDSKMAAYTASRPLHFCDRETIHTEFICDKQNYFQPVVADKPCPVAGTNHECPLKCSRTGDFYFYIWELLLSGSAEFARLQVHGVEDNQHIAEVLDTTKLELGAIKNSPFANEETRTYIVYQMTRRKITSKFPVKENGVRTQKRGTKDDWVVNLTLHPIWRSRYDYYQQQQQLLALNYQPSMKLIEQVHGENLIEVRSQNSEVRSKNLLPLTSYLLPKNQDAQGLTQFKQQLAVAYRNNAWTKEGWQAMMLDTFGTTVVSEDLDLDLLRAIAASGEERDRWCEF
ncbi:MAG: hypothetical protein QNJ72_14985 [Pleurocapsa sp. MO_226.B13]|nr:hypothetical protein [Pleurocapsa sp. MO_226.B13]